MLPLHHVHQPAGSKLCGQACVAMVAHTTLAKAVEAVGKDKATNATDLIRGLQRLKVLCDSRCTVNRSVALLPIRFGIIRLTVPRNRLASGARWCGHWVVVWDNEMYDPSPGMLPGRCSVAHEPGLRASSWIGVTP